MSNVTTMEIHTKTVDGLAIRYADTGAGDAPVILLTSPWPESLLAFRRIWPILGSRARLVAVDLPGFGHSEGRPSLFSPEAMAEFLHRLIGEFELSTLHLVGPDIGTAAALFLAARHPGAVLSLVVGGGAHDPLVPPSNGRYLAQRLPNSQLTILDTGHFAWEQVPDRYAARIAEWVTKAEAHHPPAASTGSA